MGVVKFIAMVPCLWAYCHTQSTCTYNSPWIKCVASLDNVTWLNFIDVFSWWHLAHDSSRLMSSAAHDLPIDQFDNSPMYTSRGCLLLLLNQWKIWRIPDSRKGNWILSPKFIESIGTEGCSGNYPGGVGPQALFCPVGGGCFVDNMSEGWGGGG